MPSIPPVFVVNNQLPAFDEKLFTTAEICAAAEKRCGFETIEGAQRIGALWRIYPRSSEARRKLQIEGFILRGLHVEVKDRNPFIITSPDGTQREILATKLTVSNFPLSFSDDEILQAISAMGVNLRSRLIHEKDRDSRGRLTHWKTGRRFVYIEVPKDPLPKSLEVGGFRGSLYHKEQKKGDRQKEAECNNCFQKGHNTEVCKNPVKCRQCFVDGPAPSNGPKKADRRQERTSTATATRQVRPNQAELHT